MTEKLFCALVVIVALAALPACVTLAGHPLTYSAEAIEDRVVDAETKQPLEGVIVTANWELSNAFGAEVGQMTVMESVTDASGRFYFPAWGPKFRPPNAIIKDQDPQLVPFKSGYDFVRLQNRVGPLNKDSVRRSVWNGKTIELKLFKDALRKTLGGTTTSAYARRLKFLVSPLAWAYDDNICELKKIPRMAIALHLQERKFTEKGIYNTLPKIDYILDKKWPDPCGLRDVLLRHMP